MDARKHALHKVASVAAEVAPVARSLAKGLVKSKAADGLTKAQQLKKNLIVGSILATGLGGGYVATH